MGGCCCKKRLRHSSTLSVGGNEGHIPTAVSPPMPVLKTSSAVEALSLPGRWIQMESMELGGGREVWLNREPKGGLRINLHAKRGEFLSQIGVPPMPKAFRDNPCTPPYQNPGPLNRKQSRKLRRLIRSFGLALLRTKIADRTAYFSDIHDDGIRFAKDTNHLSFDLA